MITYGKGDKENLLPDVEVRFDLKLDLVYVQTQRRYKAPFLWLLGIFIRTGGAIRSFYLVLTTANLGSKNLRKTKSFAH